MNRIILALLIIFSNSIIAQNLTFEQILNLQKKDLIGVEEFLSAKNWSLLEVEKATDEKLGTVTFAYEKSTSSDRAESFLYYMYSDNTSRINVQVQNKEKYNLYLKSVKTLGFKLTANKLEDGLIEKVYQNQSITIIISITTTKDYGATNSIYSYFILSNEDFDYNFKDEY